MSAGAALLAGLSCGSGGGAPTGPIMKLGTVSAVVSSAVVSVIIDGASSAVSASIAPLTSAPTSVGDRVVVGRVGGQMYVLGNYTQKADTGWVSVSATAKSSSTSVNVWGRSVGGVCTIYGSLNVGVALAAGNIGNVDICQLSDPRFIPSTQTVAPQLVLSSGGAGDGMWLVIDNTGMVDVAVTRAAIAVGAGVSFGGTYPAP